MWDLMMRGGEEAGGCVLGVWAQDVCVWAQDVCGRSTRTPQGCPACLPAWQHLG
jgi:hypothetical protein